MMKYNNCKFLYNVNRILVITAERERYIKFSHQLNIYLLEKYGKFYAGLQLYQLDANKNEFYVVAKYYDIVGVNEAAVIIGNEISEIYDETFGNKVRRTSILAFTEATRLVC